jgi:hypothetical protein
LHQSTAGTAHIQAQISQERASNSKLRPEVHAIIRKPDAAHAAGTENGPSLMKIILGVIFSIYQSPFNKLHKIHSEGHKEHPNAHHWLSEAVK